jgi:hypothetical protein
MSATVIKLRPDEPTASPYGQPLSPAAKSAIAAVGAASNRLERIASGNFITTTNRDQLPSLLKEIGVLVLRAMKECRT